ncbi:MAG: DegT/DnrJ/EryC1/StrS family aminotransferase [Patescibacteria group bacterium]
MQFFQKIISCSLSPNTEMDDIWEALKMILTPWRWKRGEAIIKVGAWFRRYFDTDNIVLFNSGRAALLAILKAFNIGEADEVLIQAFTCVAVPNSIIWAGAKPIYVDIDQSLNLDPTNLEAKITKRSRAVIVQHTFGTPAQIDKIVKIAKRHKLIVIEDCAHSLGGEWQGQKLGTLGDAAFFSFGRDKVVSSIWGGAVIINAKCKAQSAKLRALQEGLSYPSFFWIFQQLLHPLAFSLILMSYNWPPLWRRFNNHRQTVDITIGKSFLVILQKLHLLSVPVYPEEKIGGQPRIFPAKFPNALASVLLNQLAKLNRFNQKRRVISQYYLVRLKKQKQITLISPAPAGYLRLPITVRQPQKYLQRAKKVGVLLGRWYHHVIDPEGVDLQTIGYRLGSCPKAEAAAETILNLPTLISLHQAQRVLAAVTQK